MRAGIFIVPQTRGMTLPGETGGGLMFDRREPHWSFGFGVNSAVSSMPPSADEDLDGEHGHQTNSSSVPGRL